MCEVFGQRVQLQVWGSVCTEHHPVGNSDLECAWQVWDTAGQERYRSIVRSYYRAAHAILLVFDLTNPTSFENVEDWVSSITEQTQDDTTIMVLVGNKTDCVNKVQATGSAGFARPLGPSFDTI